MNTFWWDIPNSRLEYIMANLFLNWMDRKYKFDNSSAIMSDDNDEWCGIAEALLIKKFQIKR